MSHILVKWVSSSLWDVYNVRAIVDTSVSLQLLMDANAIVNLRGTVVAVNWKEGEPAADAELLDFGKVRKDNGAPANKAGAVGEHGFGQCRGGASRGECAERVHSVAKTQFFINFSFMELPEEMQEVRNLASSKVNVERKAHYVFYDGLGADDAVHSSSQPESSYSGLTTSPKGLQQ
ncbi:hypothetical protein HPB51_004931 [Rhipicephalus microplus]|uniref:Uncharacterized protein n=1 Tax=Rhipicephalus microplus TaxID=6941 RepID=A0A9J6EFE1_RHIMP|nr:hypothetical protein HPB51_004931 [Rhipicephalus microplus]